MGLRFRLVGIRFRLVGLRFRPVGLRFRPVGLRFRPVGLRFRPQGPRSSFLGLRFRHIRRDAVENGDVKYPHVGSIHFHEGEF